MKMGDIKGIIFDMDNTILQSRINFRLMKSEVIRYLQANRLINLNETEISNHTVSMLIAEAGRSVLFGGKEQNEVWTIVAEHEINGMKDAQLEPGIIEVLEKLNNKYHLVILTNNAYQAAVSALRANNADSFFDYIIAREQVPALKPSPSGTNYILSLYKDSDPQNWISVGDSWLDGKAAQEAGVAFISYKGDLNAMNQKGVYPKAAIEQMSDLFKYL